ncbi:MAG: hypothetical protein IPO09_04770 [Anaeromyxobacter sp.]|nr:hypothetical protein [Anaeromyxobacter sp.]
MSATSCRPHLIAAAALVLATAVAAPGPARAEPAPRNPPLAAVGPVSPVHPLPLWYQDSNGIQLEPCLDTTTTAPADPCRFVAGGPIAGLGGPFDRTLPVAYPTNFPSTVHYTWANAEVTTLVGGRLNNRGLVYIAELVGVLTPPPVATATVTTHLRFDTNESLTAFTTYTITHPYGVFTLTTDENGDLCPANQKACDITFPAAAPNGVFTGVLGANLSTNPNDTTVGSFLPVFVPPLGFIGDGGAKVQVTGSPRGTNLVRIQGPTSGPGSGDLGTTCGATVNCAEGILFTVVGRRFNPAGGPTTRFAVSGPATAGAGVAQTYTVTAADVNGNTTTGYTGIVRITSGDPLASLPGDATLVNGVGTFLATPRTVGSFVFTATDTVRTGVTGSATTTVTAGPVASLVAVSGGGQVGGTGAALGAPFVVRAADAFGNPRGGVSVTVTSPAGGSASPASGLTDLVTGQFSAVGTLGPAAGEQVFSLAAAGVAAPVTFTATAGVPGEATSLSITGLSPGVLAGSSTGFTVQALDAFGNPATLASGAAGTITISSTDPAATLPAAAQLTLGSGTFAATFRTAGSRSLTATLTARPAATASAATLVSAGPADAMTVVSGGGQGGTVGLPLALPFVVRVDDAFGNPKPGVTVVFSAQGGGAVTPLAPVTGADGTAASLGTLGPVAGAQAFAATAEVPSGGTQLFGAIAAPGPAAALAVGGLVTSLVAGVPDAFTVTARDSFGNTATSFAGTVAFTSSDPAATLPAASPLTAGAGAFSATFRTAGARVLTATVVGAPTISGSAPTTVVAASAASLAAVSGGGQSGTVGLALGAPLVARVTDAFGNPVFGHFVTFAVGTGGGSITQLLVSTDAAGQVSATATLGGAVGAQTFTAFSGTLAGSPVTFSATAAPGAAAVLDVTGLAASTTAGVAAAFTVTARDSFGNVATGFAGTVGFTSSDGAATLPAQSALTAGTAAFSATFRSAGAQTLGAAVTGAPGVVGGASTTVAAAAASTLAAVSGGGQAGVVGLALAAPLVVRAVDAFGNPVAGVTVAFAGPPGGAVAPAGVDTDAAGRAATTGTLGGAVGAQAFTATAAGLAGSPVTFAATAAPGAPATLAVTGLPPTSTAGAATSATVTVRDAFGNLATTFAGTVTLTSTDPAATLPAPGALSAGVGAFAVTFRTAGPRTLTATVTGAAAVTGGAATTVLAGPAAALAAVSGGGQTGAVGVALAGPFVVRVADAFGNPVAGTTVAFTAPATGSVTPTAAVSGADGAASAVGTLPTAPGLTSFTASAAGLAGSPVSFAATAAVGFPTRLALTSATVTTPAGTAFSVTVEAFDAFSNPATSFSGPLTFASSDPGAILPASPALALGTGTFAVTLVGAGSRTVTAALAAQPGVADTIALDVVAGPASALAYATGRGQTGQVGTALAAALVVRATDLFGNPKAGVSVTFAAPATGTVSPATAVTAADGTAGTTATLGQLAGAQSFTAASAGLSGSPVAFDATAAPGPAASLTLAGLPGELAAGTSSTLVVTALDAFGNLATGASGAVIFTSTDPAAVLPVGAALSAGTGSFPVVLRTLGSRSVTAQVLALVATATTNVLAAAPATLELVASPGTTSPAGAASTSPATVLVKDSLGNARSGVVVTFAAPAGASISPATATTDASGHASATPTVGTAVGPYLFTASVAGLAGSPASFTVTAVAGAGTSLTLVRQGAGPVLDCGCYVLTAGLQDQFGNPVAQGLTGVTVAVGGSASITATTPTFAGLPGQSGTGALGAGGTAAVTVCDQTPETAAVTVSAAGLTSASLPLTWLLGPVDAAASIFVSDTAALTAFSGRANLTVMPRTACGNPAEPGPTVTIGLNGPGTITPTRVLGDGVYGATVAIQPCPATPATQVTARIGALDLTPIDLVVTCLAPSSAETTVAFDRAELVVCDNAAKDRVQVTVTPRDDAGVAMGPGHSVLLALPGFTGGPAADALDGTYTTTLTAAGCAAPTSTLEVTVNGVTLTPPGASIGVSCAPVDGAASGVSAAGTPGVADGTTQVEVTVAAVNTCGDPARGRAVALTTTLGTLGAPTGDTDAAGTHLSWLTATQAGTATVSATVGGVAVTPASVTFNAPPGGGGGGCASGGGAGLPALVLVGLALLGGARRRRRGR